VDACNCVVDARCGSEADLAVVRFFQRRVSAEGAALGPIWLASAPYAAEANGSYFEGRERKRPPSIALDREEQERVVGAAAELVRRSSDYKTVR
jgi:hypothetical protein